MATTMSPDCTTESGLERVRFFPGQVLTADDMTQDADWVRQRLRRHNRYLHGWGIVCGCDVRPPTGSDKPWQVHICPGFILTPQGDEIYIASEAIFDVAGCLVTSGDPCAFARPCPPITRRTANARQAVYLAVRYVECEARPVRIAPVGCSCDDAQCDYSRLREAYEFCCLDTPPPASQGWGCDHLCHGDVLACPDCPPNPWVLLAKVTLPASAQTPLGASAIDLSGRQLLYSAAMLREMAVCACGHLGPTPAPPPAKRKLPPPTIDPGTSSYAADVAASMADPVAGTEVWYTTDGSDPQAGSGTASRYPGSPVTVPFAFNPTTVKARAYKPNYEASDVTSVLYTWYVIQ